MDDEYIIVKSEKYIEMLTLNPSPNPSPKNLDIIPESPEISQSPESPDPSLVIPQICESPDLSLVIPESPKNIKIDIVEMEQKNTIALSESLTENQKKIASIIYDSTKNAIKSVLLDNSVNNIMKITLMIGKTIQQIENVKINEKTPTGKDKKAVAIQLGRILIKEMVPNNEILVMYDLMADSTLEVMIDVSKVVNVEIIKCCPFKLFRSS